MACKCNDTTLWFECFPFDIEAQREKYIEQRNLNPNLRLRSDDQLGPRTQVNIQQDVSTTLQKPKSFFVELKTYKKDNPDKEIPDSDITWELLDGQWIQGVSGMN